MAMSRTRRPMRRRTFLKLTASLATSLLSAVPLRTARAGQLKGPLNARVVVVGGGFGGASCALFLRRLNPAVKVLLVDPDERYVTCPMSNSVIAGLRGIESVRVSRRGLERAGVTYVRDSVSAVDTRRRRVRLTGGGGIAYDRLVMAPGIRLLWDKPEGYGPAAALTMPHAWQAGPQTEILAAQLRGMRNGGVVAISVPAGPMRCPPGPFERASLIAGYLRENNPRAKILIFDANNHFPRQDVFSDAWQALYPGMIEWISVIDGGAVVRVEPAQKILYTSLGAHRADVANIIPAQAPALLAAQSGLASDHGWCPIRPDTFESALADHIHVIGDACIADPMPKSASAAHAQANQCALAIIAGLEQRAAPEAPLESVCYSLVARGRALSIHGRFRLEDGLMRQIATPQDRDTASFEQEARNADEWYERIRRDSFGV
jgi:NADPH-dependent 2,4-dienoyl-CoA reductase/sulfur reductase-like enzyme